MAAAANSSAGRLSRVSQCCSSSAASRSSMPSAVTIISPDTSGKPGGSSPRIMLVLDTARRGTTKAASRSLLSSILCGTAAATSASEHRCSCSAAVLRPVLNTLSSASARMG
eukprot:TRINITY_DN11055_c0_g1_i3.p5 TRINITY_DN11055_c0_g1~~TRINITY_DN11055_c0_g1_i3.p5  ORF type:complete len:112 (-),score=18.03 TRINITY_DN11055_c0_g1_i3:561-896(-)